MSAKKCEGGFFSPLKVPSGAVVSPQRGNLTGIARKVRDNCAELYNSHQRWKALNAEGLSLIRDIADTTRTRGEGGSRINVDDWKLSTGLELQTEDHWTSSKPDDLGMQCEALQNIHQKMEKLTDKIKLMSKQFESLARLQASEQCTEDSQLNQNPVFQTWPIGKYWEVSSMIQSMFEKEVASKRRVVENIAHTVHDDELLFLMAVWSHEPYLEPNLPILLESMLVETKHR